jgi:hypothetical protein
MSAHITTPCLCNVRSFLVSVTCAPQALPYLCPNYSLCYALWSYPGIPYHNVVLSLPFSPVCPFFFCSVYLRYRSRDNSNPFITTLAILLFDMSFSCTIHRFYAKDNTTVTIVMGPDARPRFLRFMLINPFSAPSPGHCESTSEWC